MTQSKGVKYITTTAAGQIASRAGLPVSRPTLISWIRKNKIGHKVGGRWRVDEKGFKDFLGGKPND